MIDPVDRAVRAVALRHSSALVWLQFGVAHLVLLGGVGLLSLYEPLSTTQFWVLTAVSQGVVVVDNAVSVTLTRRLWAPFARWEHGERDRESTVSAWVALATLPIAYVRAARRTVLFSYLPLMAFFTWELRLPWDGFFVLAVVGSVVLAYGLILRYFMMEVVVRPVVERVAEALPPDFSINAPGLPMPWRLLAVAPVINVITGVVVAGLVDHRHQASLSDLGLSWVVAVAVSFTISLELTVLVVRSVVSALRDLRRATERVRAGDFSARVPVVSTDETGALAQSFNTMIEGLDERERLRSAFGAFVDPGLAERVIKEGPDLAGEEVEVSILFLDIRNFTAFAERSAPTEVVALLSDLWELAVPVLLHHGGHANKFIGDGLLGVFGAPEPLPDHADRALQAALEIAHRVRQEFQGRIEVGIGVNSGPVVAGTVGGGGRVEFSVIGDAVNTAARVEAATRETGDEVLITEDTRRRLRTEGFELDERKTVELKGKQVHVPLWAPRAHPAEGSSHDRAGASVAD
jgi:class 3 adenylate cyclase